MADARALYEFERYAGELERAPADLRRGVGPAGGGQSALEQAAAARTQAPERLRPDGEQRHCQTLQQAEKQEKRGVTDAALADLKKSLESTVLRAETDGKVTELKVNVAASAKAMWR